ncbi:hypothetical protein F9817_23540, partial [Vibrio sp. CAIM 722]
VYGFNIDKYYMYLPLVMCAQFFINATFGFLVAAIIPIFPDLKIIVSNGLRVAFYLSGILYSVNDLPSQYHVYFEYNPMTQIVTMYRQILMNGDLNFNVFNLLLILLLSIIMVQLSITIVNKLDSIYPRLLLQK